MEQKRFESMMLQADTMKTLSDKPDYFTGYLRGLRRLFHGTDFGTEAEHSQWLSMIDDDLRQDMGHGYKDGFAGLTPNGDRWEYCTQNDCDCSSCSLVNYGRDCCNNAI